MHILLIFVWVVVAMTAFSFAEAYVEGRNAGFNGKLGFKIKVFGTTFAAYHFFLFYVMFPMFLLLPFIAFGMWDTRVFGILVSAFCLGIIVEDFMWYVVNPVVKVRELWSDFSDYYPWFRLGGKKIVPLIYIGYGLVGIVSWYFLWR